MKWKYFDLPSNAQAARSHLFDNLAVGMYEHFPLSTQLASTFSNAGGPVFAITMDAMDWELVTDFRRAGSYAGGKLLSEAITSPHIPMGDSPLDGLIAFLQDWVRTASDRLVVIEDFWRPRSIYVKQFDQRSTRRFLQERVYHVITAADDAEQIEEAIREPFSQSSVGVCAEHIVSLCRPLMTKASSFGHPSCR